MRVEAALTISGTKNDDSQGNGVEKPLVMDDT
jgi:hypothetical protein